MDFPISTLNKQTLNTPNEEGQISPCSCDECDTNHCVTRRYPIYNNYIDDKFFYTNVTVNKSNTDTARSESIKLESTQLGTTKTSEPELEVSKVKSKDITKPKLLFDNTESKVTTKPEIEIYKFNNNANDETIKPEIELNKYKMVANNSATIPESEKTTHRNKKETECVICRKIFKPNKTPVTTYGASSLIDLINTKKSICEMCKANMKKINKNADLPRNEPIQLGTMKTSKPESEVSKLRSEDITQQKSQFVNSESKVTAKPQIDIYKYKNYANDDTIQPEIELCNYEMVANNSATKSKSEKSEHRNKKETDCEMCRNIFKLNKTSVTPYGASSLINIINTRKSVCEMCITIKNADLPRNESTQLGTTKTSKPELEVSKVKSEDITKPKLQFDNSESKFTTRPEIEIPKYKNNANDDTIKPEIELCKYKMVANSSATKSKSEKNKHRNKKETECEICRKMFKPNKTSVTSYGASSLIDLINTRRSICKICIANSNENHKNAYLPRNESTQLGATKTSKPELEVSKLRSEDITKPKSQFVNTESEVTTKPEPGISKYKNNDTNDDTRKPASDKQTHTRKSKCKICMRDFQNIGATESEMTPIERILKKTSTCKLGGDYTKNKINIFAAGTKPTGNICGISKCKIYGRNMETLETANVKNSTANSHMSLSEKIDSKSICTFCQNDFLTNMKTDTVDNIPTESICIEKLKSNIYRKLIEGLDIAFIPTVDSDRQNKTINPITSLCQFCEKDNVDAIHNNGMRPSEKKCTGKSNCQVCRKDIKDWEIALGKTPKIKNEMFSPPCLFCKKAFNNLSSRENICYGKSKCKVCKKDIEEREVPVYKKTPDDRGITLGEERDAKTSSCQLCKRNIENSKGARREKTCKRHNEEWQITPSEKVNVVTSQCQFCKRDNGIKGSVNAVSNKNMPTENICKSSNKTKNQTDTINDGVILMDKIHVKNSQCNVSHVLGGSCYRKNTVEVSKNTLLPSEKITRNCQNTLNDNQTDLVNSTAVTKVTNAKVTYFRKVPNSGAAKLTAQIMNVPYEEFDETLKQQETDVTKHMMKSSLSKDIFKRIVDIYKACSCKFCECVAGKSITLDNGCNCKPCDCQDCKALKTWHTLDHSFSETKFSCLNKDYPKEDCTRIAKQVYNEPCDCMPCECIKCKQNLSKSCNCTPCDCYECKSVSQPLARNYIAARVADDHHSDNCTCTPCRCLECERNFFSLSSHLTHEMSTGMSRSCRCEQCLDQRCVGAGGNDDCRCEGPSKAIFKPVEKDSHDYDIHRAAVCLPRNTRNYSHDAIAMYASISSNFPHLGTLKEACNCEECDCVVCKGENSKTSVKTILKPQLAPLMQSTEAKTCTCKSCQCEMFTSANVPGCDLYHETECKCDICDCISCPFMAKLTTSGKMNLLAKPIGKINYGNNESERNDVKKAINEGLLGLHQNVCLKATVKKNCFISSKDFEPFLASGFDDKQKNNVSQKLDTKKVLLANTHSARISQDLAGQLYNELSEMSSKTNFYEDILMEPNNNYNCKNDKNCVSKCNKYFQSDVNLKLNKSPFKYTKSLDSKKSMDSFPCIKPGNCKYIQGNKKIKSNSPWPFFLSNYEPNYSNTTNIDYNTHAYDNVRTNKSDDFGNLRVYDHVKPFSNFYRNLYSKKLSAVELPESLQSDVHCRYDIKNQSHIGNSSSTANYKSTGINLIDYDRINNTLKEAKDFSGQLMKLLGKYEKANKDFQSVSEKLKILHESDECSKLKDTPHFQLGYVIVEKQNNIDNNSTLVNTMKEVYSGFNDIGTSLRITNSIMKLDSTTTENSEFIFTDNYQNRKCYENNTLAQRERCQSNHMTISTTDHIEITKNDNRCENIDLHAKSITNITANNIKAKEILKNDHANIEKDTAKSKVFQEDKISIDANEDKTTSFNDKVLNIEDKTKHQLKEFEETMPNEYAMEVQRPIPESTQNKIDILTNQLSEMIKDTVIKNYEETSGIVKYDSSTDKFNNNYLKSQASGVDEPQDWLLNKYYYYLHNNPKNMMDLIDMSLLKNEKKEITKSVSVQTMLETPVIDSKESHISMKAAFSLPRNKTTQVDKESDTRADPMMNKHQHKHHHDKPSGSTLRSLIKPSGSTLRSLIKPSRSTLRSLMKPSGSTLRSFTKPSGSTLKSSEEFDQCRFTAMNSNRPSEMGEKSSSCKFQKVGFLGGRRISDHTVMVKWSKPRQLENVLGYELLVDGRPVQKIIDSSRCMAVVTCLPNCEKVLLTMKTILAVPPKSGHQPSVTLVYRPRLKLQE